MNRFFIKSEYIDNDVVEIDGEDFNHISNSLRLQTGDKIVISPGDGYDYIVELVEFNSDTVFGKIIDKEENITEPKINIDLAQAIPKNRNIEFVIQKGTEIGVNKIIPIETKRTIVKLSGSKEKRRIKRWQKISEEAAKQSQRGKIPQINSLVDINNRNKTEELFSGYDLIFVLYAGNASNNIKKSVKKYEGINLKDILVLIGPEGGFAEEEIDLFNEVDKEKNIEIITLGNRILRTETAGLVALTSLLYEFGDLGG